MVASSWHEWVQRNSQSVKWHIIKRVGLHPPLALWPFKCLKIIASYLLVCSQELVQKCRKAKERVRRIHQNKINNLLYIYIYICKCWREKKILNMFVKVSLISFIVFWNSSKIILWRYFITVNLIFTFQIRILHEQDHRNILDCLWCAWLL